MSVSKVILHQTVINLNNSLIACKPIRINNEDKAFPCLISTMACMFTPHLFFTTKFVNGTKSQTSATSRLFGAYGNHLFTEYRSNPFNQCLCLWDLCTTRRRKNIFTHMRSLQRFGRMPAVWFVYRVIVHSEIDKFPLPVLALY